MLEACSLGVLVNSDQEKILEQPFYSSVRAQSLREQHMRDKWDLIIFSWFSIYFVGHISSLLSPDSTLSLLFFHYIAPILSFFFPSLFLFSFTQ